MNATAAKDAIELGRDWARDVDRAVVQQRLVDLLIEAAEQSLHERGKIVNL